MQPRRTTKRLINEVNSPEETKTEGNSHFNGRTLSIFPTPTSLENAKFAKRPRTLFQGIDNINHNSNHLPSVVDSVDDVILENSLETTAIGHGENVLLPLIMKKVERRTKNFSVLRRSLRRRPLGGSRVNSKIVVMGNSQQQGVIPSIMAKENIPPRRLSSLASAEDHIRRLLGGLPIVYNEKLCSIPVREHQGSFFENCPRLSAPLMGGRPELEASLMTIIWPMAKSVWADCDTAFLAYNLVARYAQTGSVIRATTRSQLYVAAFLVASKFNEEEDAEIAQLVQAIETVGKPPPTFKPPTASEVIRFECRLMKEIGWQVADIVTPTALLRIFLDCFSTLDREQLRRIVNTVNDLMGILFNVPEIFFGFLPWLPMTHFWLSYLLSIALIKEFLPKSLQVAAVAVDLHAYLYLLFTQHSFPNDHPTNQEERLARVRSRYEELRQKMLPELSAIRSYYKT